MSAIWGSNVSVQQQVFIHEYYDLVLHHPHSKFSDWNTFVLDQSDKSSVRSINGLFISRFGDPGSVVLIENWPSFKLFAHTQKDIDSLCIDSPRVTAHQILGWGVQEASHGISSKINLMMETLQKVHLHVGKGGFIFFFVNFSNLGLGLSEFLQSLSDFIQDRKNIAVLAPKASNSLQITHEHSRQPNVHP